MDPQQMLPSQSPQPGAMSPGLPAPGQPTPKPLKLSAERKGKVRKAKTRGYRSIVQSGYGPWVRRLPLFDERTIEEMIRDDMVSLCLKMRAAPISAVKFEYKDLHTGNWVPGIRASHEAIGVFVLRQLHTIWAHLDCITASQEWGHSAGEITLKLTRFNTVEIDRLLPRRAMDCRPLIRGGFPVGVRIRGTDSGNCDLMYPYCWWHTYNPRPGSNYGQSALYAAQSPWFDKWQEGGALDIQRLFMHSNAFGGVDVSYPAGRTHVEGRGLVDNAEIAFDIATQLRTGSVTTRPSERDDKGNEKWTVTRGATPANPSHILEYPEKCDDRIRVALGVPDDLITADGGTGAWAGKRIPMLAFYASLDTWVTRIITDLTPILKELVKINFGRGHWFEVEHRPLADQASEEQQPGGDPMGMGGASLGFDDPAGGEVPPSGDPDFNGGMLRMSLVDDDGEDALEKARVITDILASIYGPKVDRILEELLGVQRMSLGGRVWNPDDHPRGPDGRFIEKGTAAGYQAARDAVKHVKRNRKDPEARKSLMSHLQNLTVKQLHKLKKAHGVKASAKVRADLVQKLAERLGHYKHGKDERENETPVDPHVDAVYTVPTEALNIDPKRFQYKVQGIRADGVTDEMREVGNWNPLLGGTLLVWRDPDTGEDFVVNGHHRYELAKRAGQDILNVRYIDADNAKEARAQGALANIAEGRGTPVDAAKYLRDSGMSVSDLKEAGISLKGKVAEDAVTLTALSDRMFQRVTEGTVETSTAIAVAKHLKDHDLQNKLFKKIEDREDQGLKWDPRQIERAAQKMASAGKVSVTTETLFGDWDSEESTFDQEVEIEEYIARRMATQRFDYAATANVARAERIKGAGNVLATEENARLRDEMTDKANTFERESKLRGPVSEKVKSLAVELAGIKSKKAKEAFLQRAYDEVVATMDPPAKVESTPEEQPPAENPAYSRLIKQAESAVEAAERVYRNAVSQGEDDKIQIEKDVLDQRRRTLDEFSEKIGAKSTAQPQVSQSQSRLDLEIRNIQVPLDLGQMPDDWQSTVPRIRTAAKSLMDQGADIPRDEQTWRDPERLKAAVQRAIDGQKRPKGKPQVSATAIPDGYDPEWVATVADQIAKGKNVPMDVMLKYAEWRDR